MVIHYELVVDYEVLIIIQGLWGCRMVNGGPRAQQLFHPQPWSWGNVPRRYGKPRRKLCVCTEAQKATNFQGLAYLPCWGFLIYKGLLYFPWGSFKKDFKGILNLQKSCKNSTEFPHIPHCTSLTITIFHDRSRVLKNRVLSQVQYWQLNYRPYLNVIIFSTNVLFLYQDPKDDPTLYFVVISP